MIVYQNSTHYIFTSQLSNVFCSRVYSRVYKRPWGNVDQQFCHPFWYMVVVVMISRLRGLIYSDQIEILSDFESSLFCFPYLNVFLSFWDWYANFSPILSMIQTSVSPQGFSSWKDRCSFWVWSLIWSNIDWKKACSLKGYLWLLVYALSY